MATSAPGKHYRKGMSLMEAVGMFSDEAIAEAWFVEQRWPDGVECPDCNSHDIQHRTTRKPQPFRCNECRKDFSVKTASIMHASKLPLKAWGLAIYLVSTNLKGVSSMKLHRDLGVTQKTAWHLGHRIREAWAHDNGLFAGPVEADETAIGGLEKNKHADKKLRNGRGSAGKTIVHGMLDRPTNQVSAAVVDSPNAVTLQGRVLDATETTAQVYTDEATAYNGMARRHEAVNHSTGEYVREQAHTNGIESFWAMLDRGIMGTFHHVSPKHLDRYVTEFAGRHNQRPSDTIAQMRGVAHRMGGKRLSYRMLTA